MAQRSAIQLRPTKLPLRHEAVHQLGEPVAVMPFQEVRHLMGWAQFNAFYPQCSGTDFLPLETLIAPEHCG
jgi:hypothetical protein